MKTKAILLTLVLLTAAVGAAAGQAQQQATPDPAVGSGLFVPEMYPWWSEAFLVRGDKWTPEKTPATESDPKP